MRRCYFPLVTAVLLTAFAVLSAGLAACAANKDTGVGPALKGATMTVPRYGKFETSFQLPDTAGNPFDPADNDVWAIFTGPKGHVERVPAFWDGDGGWKVRFSPTQPGRYSLRIARNGKQETPEGLTFASLTCTASSDPGFVRRDPSVTQRFVFDNGATYYPFGCDQAWQGGPGASTYPETFAKMKGQGMNWARIWMNHWDGKNLEWTTPTNTSPPIGQYSLTVARHWDDIVDSATANGVYIQLTLQHHGQYTIHADSNWSENPFNVANGGFLKNPQDFFTDPRAIALTKAKFRYIIARWGYSDHIMGWELFNEVQNISEAPIDTVIAWHKTMAAYIRSIDPNHHLITSSYTDPGNALEQGVPLDYDQVHSYVPDIISLFASVDTSKASRPFFWGECGSNGRASEGFVHDLLWSGVMTTLAGGPMFWGWDQIDSGDWWPQYGVVSRYLASSGVEKRTDLVKVAPAISTPTRGDISFAPSGGWGPTTSYDVTVSPDTGAVTGLGGVSMFIQGKSHPDMMSKPVVLHVNYPQSGQFVLRFGQISDSGAHPQILLDGKVSAETDLPGRGNGASDQLMASQLSVNVPAGQHDIGIFNTGPDWFTVRRMTLTNYAPAIGVAAKGDRSAVYFWAYDRNRPYDGPAAGSPPAIDGKLSFSGLADGPYAITLWDTSSGAAASHITAMATGGVLTMPVTVTSDTAGWAVRK